MKKRQSVLELPLEASRLLDTLCLEAVLTTTDDTSLGLLEYRKMLGWLSEQAVSREQFTQLYSAWCQAKPLPDVLASCQEEALGKQLVAERLPRQESKLRELVETLREEYLTKLLQQHYSQSLATKLPLVRNIFSMLDQDNVGHVRRQNLLQLLEAMVAIGTVKLSNSPSVQNLLERLVALQKQLCGVDGVLTYRNLCNGLLNKQLTNVQLQEIMSIVTKNKPKHDVFDAALLKWKASPRFFKRKIDRYRRLFEEHDWLFMSVDPDPYEIEAALERLYGRQFLVLADVDFVVIREFNELLKAELTERLRHHTPSNNRSVSNKKADMQTPRSHSTKKHPGLTRSTTKPQKHGKQKPPANLALTSTPKKLSSTISTTPKRQWQPEVLRSGQITTFSKKNSHEEEPSSNNLRSKKSPMNGHSAHNGLEDNLNQATFFKNRRVESFEIVMKRLRSKRP